MGSFLIAVSLLRTTHSNGHSLCPVHHTMRYTDLEYFLKAVYLRIEARTSIDVSLQSTLSSGAFPIALTILRHSEEIGNGIGLSIDDVPTALIRFWCSHCG
jgi:hypothetical protein